MKSRKLRRREPIPTGREGEPGGWGSLGRLRSLAMPEADASVAAGRFLERLPYLWSAANAEERRRILMTMLDAVYVDARDEKRIVAIKPKAGLPPAARDRHDS